jgi:hypothetical protein
MRGLRHFIRARSSGRLLAVWLAYSLAAQALMMSVGLGMSAFAAPGPSGLVICSFAAHLPATTGDSQIPAPRPLCPFCFIAAQCAGHSAAAAEAPALPGYAAVALAGTIAGRPGTDSFVPQFSRKAGDPRAPPPFSV